MHLVKESIGVHFLSVLNADVQSLLVRQLLPSDIPLGILCSLDEVVSIVDLETFIESVRCLLLPLWLDKRSLFMVSRHLVWIHCLYPLLVHPILRCYTPFLPSSFAYTTYDGGHYENNDKGANIDLYLCSH